VGSPREPQASKIFHHPRKTSPFFSLSHKLLGQDRNSNARIEGQQVALQLLEALSDSCVGSLLESGFAGFIEKDGKEEAVAVLLSFEVDFFVCCVACLDWSESN
jgi:hypothetical protein